jgi:integrase
LELNKKKGFSMRNIRKINNKKGIVSWQIDYTDRNGKRIRRSYRKLKDAKRALEYFNAFFSKNIFDESTYRIKDLVKRYNDIYNTQKSFYISKQYFIRHIINYFKNDRLLKTINYVALQEFKKHLMNKLKMNNDVEKLSNATVNKILSCFRHMLNNAVSLGMIIENPFNKGESLRLTENNLIDRFLSKEEILRLLKVSPDYLCDIIICAINSGLRKTELLTLKWEQVDYENMVLKLPETKEGKKQFVPLNKDLIELFESIGMKHAKNNIDSDRIFLWKNFSKKYTVINTGVSTALKSACMRAGIKYGRPDGVTFNILRHTALTYIVKHTKSLFIAKQIARHKDIKSTQRYAHIAMDDLQKASNTLNGLCE